MHAARCGNPLKLAHIDVIVVGYNDPALGGETVTFICPPGLVHIGPTTSTCMRNGEWEPDPGEVECTGGMGTTSATTLGMP